MRFRTTLATVALAALAAAVVACGPAMEEAAAAPQSDRQVNPDAKVQSEFTERVEQYVALRNKLASEAPPLPKDAEPEQMAAHQSALLKELSRARAGAKPGDIFTPETRALIRRLLANARKQPTGDEAKSAIQEENPGTVKIRVNGEYSSALPRTTVPPQILLALPRLSDKDLEYRFVGRRLVLIDSRASMIVDYMENAI
jgi:hypothetical protein